MKRSFGYVFVIVILSMIIIPILGSPVMAATYYGKTQTTDATFGSGDSFYNKSASIWPPSLGIPTALTITGGTTTLNGSTVLGYRGIFISPSGAFAGSILNGASVSTRVNIIPGSYWAAVAVEGTGAWAEINDSTITGNGVGTHGVLAANSGSVSVSDSSVTANGMMSNALHAEDSGSIIMTGGSVTANGMGSHGLYADDSGRIEMAGGSVSTSGLVGSHAVRSSGNGSGVALDGVDVSTNGVWNSSIGLYAYGLYADDGGSVGMTGGSVSTSGALSHAVTSEGDGSSVLLGNGPVISTSGISAYGLYATDGGLIIYAGAGGVTPFLLSLEPGSAITTVGDLAHAVRSSGTDSNINMTDTSLITEGDGAYGLYADDEGQISMEGGSVTTYGDYSYGVKTEGLNALAELSDGVVMTTHGENAYGLYSDPGGVIYMDGGSVTTYGDFAHAVRSSGLGSEAYLTDVSLYTEGTGAYGLYADDEGYISMEGGSIESLDGTYMFVGTDGRIDLFGVEAGSEDADSLLVTDSSGTVNADDGTQLTGNVRHTGDSDGYLDLTLSGGSVLTGTVNSNINNLNSGINVTLSDNSALWNVTGNSITVGSLSNAGTVDYQFSETADPVTMSFVVPDSDYSGYKMVSVVDFTGLIDSDSGIPGTLKMKADIDGNEGDLLYIAGTAEGENLVDVQIISNSGSDRMDGLIEVDDSEATASFSLADPDGVVDAGAWNYILAEGMVGSAKEWYLKRNGLTTVGRGIVSSLVGSDIWYTEVDTLFNRTGLYKDGYSGGVWANVAAKKSEFSPESGIEFEQKFKTISLGYDKKIDQKEGCPSLYQGVMVGYGTADRDISDNIGNTDIDSFHASFYSLFRWDDGLYVTGLLKYNHYKSDMTVTRLDDFSADLGQALGFDTVTGRYEQDGGGFSLMAGKRFDAGKEGWYWEPQLQLSWMLMSGDDYTTNSGIDVNISSSNSIQARGGVLFGKSFETSAGSMLDLFAKISIVHEFDGKTDLTMSGAKYTSDLSGTWGVYGVGMNWQVGKGQYINANFQYADGSGRTDPWAAQLGFSLDM
jgi:outer membrane autotransporter protein